MEYKKGLTQEQIKELENREHTVIKKIGMYKVQILHYKENIKKEYAKLQQIHKELWGIIYD